ncbi:MAG: ethanolamine ammonia-lyase subunit EutC [Lachnospiraceae bacterium]|nr:ethanolamine ammonia-lyase subunit EutC [Lachnospiraceae bacterium]
MIDQNLIDLITREVMKALGEAAGESAPAPEAESVRENDPASGSMESSRENADDPEGLIDLTSAEYKAGIQLQDPENELALRAMRRATTARIGLGRAGNRPSTRAMLSFRADHAMAKDAVMKPVDQKFLDRMGLHTVVSKCGDINEHLTRPDLGRQLTDESIKYIEENCVKNPQIQIYVSDGLSNAAIENNAEDLLSILMEGLKDQGIKLGTPFFVKYGRVPTMDKVSELTGAELTCVLIGERPGLAASDSMSAYITYGAYVGISESSRTVVSNIHKNGIQPVEAGAYLSELLLKILEAKKSGVEFKQ